MDEVPSAPADPIALFDALMDAVETDVEAGEGLAEAYRGMSGDVRARLVETIADDARGRGRSMVEPLLALLAVEEDGDRAAAIVERLREQAPAPSADTLCWVHGDRDEGGVAVAQPRFGDRVGLVYVSYASNAIEVRSEELVRRSEVSDVLARLGVPPESERRARGPALGRMAEAVWRAVRRGVAIPSALRRHVDLFDPRA